MKTDVALRDLASRFVSVLADAEDNGGGAIEAAKLRLAIELHAALGEKLAHASPVPMLLWCPECGARHIDSGEFETKPHHTHACQQCGMVWRPAIVPTVGVWHLPGFKNGEKA